MSGARWYPASRPRVAADGVAVRSRRGAIGDSWWSRRFIAVLESFALGTRLTRGRTYARKGQVSALALGPGRVTAKVQGSRARPYSVAVVVPTFTDDEWDRICAHLAGQAVFSAQLLAGQVPDELEAVLAEVGVDLFPTRFAQFDASCSCPDVAVPCKHLAATFYLLAEHFDDDPFEVLHWRGRPRDPLLAAVHALRTTHADPRTAPHDGPDDLPAPDADAATAPGVPAGTAPGASACDELQPLTTADFWCAPPPPPLPGPATAPAPADLVLRQLGPAPAELGGAAFTTLLDRTYATVTRRRADEP